MLKKYLEAEGIEISGTSFSCPRCGHIAWLQPDNTWRCIRCNVTGDTLDFAMTLHPEQSEDEALRYIHSVLGLKLHELNTVEASALMDMEFKPTGFLIEKLLGKGVYILAGASKIGKSWLVLWLADCISKGLPVWELKTAPCAVLYVSLEDTQQRIQQRLNDVTGGETGALHIATESELLGGGFEEQLTGFLMEHPDVGFVIIDTLQRIRPVKAEKYSYAGDYEVMTALKNIADTFNITILLVHHTRKEESGDAFNMISGTTGLLGCADGALVLQKPSRLSPEATLDVTGREIADLQLRLRFNEQTKHWDFVGYGKDELPQSDPILEAVQALVAERRKWQGTATELLELLQGKLDPNTKPNMLARRLNASASRLEQDYGVDYRTSRSPDARIIQLSALRHDGYDDHDDILAADAAP
ncbi:MAG: helicase RepA family protein [Oscillospiraceae bacterium]|nr:helicase RepA family protein [Oscillospiraceae bacterium]